MLSQEQTSPPTVHAVWGPRQVGLSLLALVGLGIVIGLVMSGLRAAWPLVNVELLAVLVLEGGLLGLAWWFGPKAKGSPISSLGFHRVELSTILRYGLVALLGSLTIGSFYILMAQRFAPELVPPPLPEGLRVKEFLVVGFLAIALVGPVAEEAFFRGFVFSGLAAQWGVWPAALVGAGIFAVTHGQVALMIPAFASGLLFTWTFRRTGSLWPGVLAHVSQNALAVSAVVQL